MVSTPPTALDVSMGAKSVLVVITGASRGIGRELALQLGKRFSASSVTFVLLARSEDALEEVKVLLLKECLSAKVELVVSDLAQQPFSGSESEAKVADIVGKSTFDLCLVVHNAGTLGEMAKKSSQLSDEVQWHQYLQTNLVSTILLNNKIYAAIDKKEEARIFVVNITSLLSVKAYPSFTQYSTGKAAREAYFRAFAAEHPKCRVLNYSPGPVDTNMHAEVARMSYDAGVREVFEKKRHDSNLNRKLLTPSDTVKRLIRLLEENKFESGSRIDYFDK